MIPHFHHGSFRAGSELVPNLKPVFDFLTNEELDQENRFHQPRTTNVRGLGWDYHCKQDQLKHCLKKQS